MDFGRLKPGDRVWKTSDPQLERELRRTYKGDIPLPKTRIDLTVSGEVGRLLTVEANGVRVNSSMPLQTAFKRPLTEKALRDQLGRLGETDFVLGEIHNKLVGQTILPVSELNRLRRELVEKIQSGRQVEDEEQQPHRRDAGPSTSCWRTFPQRGGRPSPATGCALSNDGPDHRRAGIRLRHHLRGFRGHPPLSRGRRAGASAGRGANLSGHATNSKSRRAGVLQVDRSRQAGRSSHSQPRRAGLFPEQFAAKGRRFFAQCRPIRCPPSF